MVYIWIRATLDWADERAALAELSQEVAPQLPVWNDVFDMSYPRFRHRIAQIAELNHSRVQGARRARWEEIPDGALVLPVDDDDWFAPDAARILERELSPGVSGYVWESRWIEVPFHLRHRLYLLARRLIPAIRPQWVCTTNNYALIKEPESSRLLASHIAASRSFEPRLLSGDHSVKWIDGQLSVANRTVGSKTTLESHKPMITRSWLLKKFRQYQRLYDSSPPAELEWCRTYMRMMGELMAELRPADSAR